MGCSVNGGGVSLGSEFGSIGYLNYCDGMRGRSVINVDVAVSIVDVDRAGSIVE